MAKHKNKHIREAIAYALAHGWNFEKSQGHILGTLRCPIHGGCRQSVYSTPRVPEHHARRIQKLVDQCPHQRGESEENEGETDG